MFSYADSLRIHGASERSARRCSRPTAGRMSRSWPPCLAAQHVYDEIWRIYDRQRRRLSRLQPLERTPHVQPDGSEVASVRPALASSPHAATAPLRLLRALAGQKEQSDHGWRRPASRPVVRERRCDGNLEEDPSRRLLLARMGKSAHGPRHPQSPQRGNPRGGISVTGANSRASVIGGADLAVARCSGSNVGGVARRL